MKCHICKFHHGGYMNNSCDLINAECYHEFNAIDCPYIDDNYIFIKDYDELGFIAGKSAFKSLKEDLSELKTAYEYINNHFNDRFFDGNFKAHKAKEKALLAINKQIPQKPIVNSYYDEPCLCPACNHNVINKLDSAHKFNYCYHCGQALDWDEIEKGGAEE